MIAGSIFVPKYCQSAAMILHAVEAEPVPGSGGKEREDFHAAAQPRPQSDNARDHQVGKRGVVVIPTPITFPVDPLSGGLIEVFADVRLAIGALAVDESQEGVKVIA